MKNLTKKYTNGEITVLWKPDMCIHSAICFNGLPQVFDPRNRPWVNITGADTKRIKEQIDRCPSGALSYSLNNSTSGSDVKAVNQVVVEITENGPLIIRGEIILKEPSGNSLLTENQTALCRCGSSNNKPFCDGTHKLNGFKG